MWFSSYPDAVQLTSGSGTLDEVLNDCRECFDCKQSSGSYSTGTTFFISADAKPRCTLERLALEIFRHHTREIPEMDSSSSGAEWWTQYIDTRDDIGFHWDRDYGLEEESILRYPDIATVTYLSGNGGNTIIADLAGDLEITEELIGTTDSFSRFAVSRLIPRKHIAFSGHLLHGAPSNMYEVEEVDDKISEDEYSEEGMHRVTFLVNIWINHKPKQILQVSNKLMKKLSDKTDISMAFLEGVPSVLTMSPHSIEVSRKYTGKVIQNEKSYQLTIHLPVEEELAAKLSDNDSVIIECSEGAGYVEFLGEEEEEEDDDDDDDDDNDDDDDVDDDNSNSNADGDVLVQASKKPRTS
jgi:hypothetical protein